MSPEKYFDRYVLQARIMPALLVVLPLSLAVSAWMPEDAISLKLASGLVSLVFLSLLAQVGRAGKVIEPILFEKWGGKPSIIKLRHGSKALNWITLSRIHSEVGKAVGVTAPTPTEEEADPAAADEIYTAFNDYLLEATRGDAILRSENISYGFRRNLLGMRSGGLGCCTIGLLGTGSAAALDWATPDMALPAVATLLVAALTTCWLVRVNEAWVRHAADAYADRLVRAWLNSAPAKSASETGN